MVKKILSLGVMLLGVLWLAAQPAYVREMVSPRRPVATASYLIKQDFEGTGYDNGETWTEAGTATPDEDYTGVALAGSQSLRVVTTSATSRSSVSFSAAGTVEVYFLFRPVVASAEAGLTIVQLRSADDAAEAIRLRWLSSGRLDVRAGGGTVASPVTVLSVDTTYHVWVRFVVGTGANAVATVAFSTTGTRPSSGNEFAQTSNGTATANAGILRLGTITTTTVEMIFDKVRVDDATIGDNPT